MTTTGLPASRTADVTIVGAGAIGCAAAWWLARRGASVDLLDATLPGDGASGAAAGVLGPLADSVPEGYMTAFALDAFRTIDEHAGELAGAATTDFGYRREGVLRVALTDDGVAHWRDFRARRGRLGLDLHWLDPGQLRSLQPRLHPSVRGGLFSPRETHLLPGPFTRALAEAAQRAGARLRLGVRVTGVERAGDRVAALLTTEGRLPVGVLIVAAGAEAAALGDALGVALPVRPVRGQMAALRPEPRFDGAPIFTEDALLVPKPGGEVWVGATYEEAGFDRRVTVDGLSWLMNRAAAIAPDLADGTFLRAWAGLRPASPDGLPLLGPLPGLTNAHAALGFYRNGILMSLLAGRIVAGLVLDNAPGREIAPLDPARFA